MPDLEVLALAEDVVRLALLATGWPGYARPRGATEAELDAFEARTGLTLAPEHRALLAIADGVLCEPGGLFGLTGIEEALEPEWRERGWVPVAGDGCGQTWVTEPCTQHGWHVGFIEPMQAIDRIDRYEPEDLLHFLQRLLREELRASWTDPERCES